MKAKNYEVYCLELSKYVVDYAKYRLGLNVVQGTIDDAKFPNAFFDMITLWDVFEHTKNPMQVLAECRRIMRPGGVLIIETLNVDSFLARILRSRWPLYTPPYHLSYFSRRTIGLALHENGFNLRRTIPIQTYTRMLAGGGIMHGFKPLRYYRYSALASTVGRFFDDVILTVSTRE
jgi:2-polyprenyl-3-methyl-5-hydroxy-6-metoxy-1,4-benzoquinol methylase